jgi:DNA-binding NarL/FixJ family response regulator
MDLLGLTGSFVLLEVKVDKQRIAALYGNSLFIASLEACLRDRKELAVVRIDVTVPDAMEHLATLCPDVVICDLDASQAEFVTSFLREHPGLPLLGLTDNNVVVLSSQQYTALTANDLTQVIQGIKQGTTE